MSTRSLAASVAANTRWAHTSAAGRRQQSKALLAGQERRYARLALDPEGRLSEDELDALIAETPPAELKARIANARKAHMQRASLAAAKARRRTP
jgi:hypothetical protein